MFKTHKLTEQGFKEMKKYKSTMAKAVMEVLKIMPESKEKDTFKVKLEEGMFFGAKAIASKDQNYSEIIDYLKED